jgi:hypothetical protein
VSRQPARAQRRGRFGRLEVGDWGLREAAWAELQLTASRQQFLGDQQPFLRNVA